MRRPTPTPRSQKRQRSISRIKDLEEALTKSLNEIARGRVERNELGAQLSKVIDEHAATHDDLRKADERCLHLEHLCNDLRNQMVTQGIQREEQTCRIQRLEGYIERVRELDSLKYMGVPPSVAIPDGV